MQATSPAGNTGHSLPEQPSPIRPVIWGAVLIICGALFLLQSLGFFPNASVWLVSALFGIVAAVFLALFLIDRERSWWAAIPGMTMAGLALMVYLGGYGGAVGEVWAAPLFLVCIALGFLLAMVGRGGMWWAIIPIGVLLSVALMVGLSASGAVSPDQSVAVLFFGMAATFLLVPLVSGKQRRWWSLIPAVVLGGMGWLFYTGNLEALANIAWIGPAIMIAAGIWIVYKSAIEQRSR